MEDLRINTAPIADYIRRHGLSIQEFAVVAGVSTTTVSNWLTGKKGMRPRVARRLEQNTRGEIRVRVIFRDLLTKAA